MSEYKLSLLVEAIDKASGPLKDVAGGLGALADSADKTLREVQPLGVALTALSAAGSALVVSSVMTAARTEELGMVLNVMAENARQAAIDEGDLARASDLTAESVWGAVEAIKAKGITTQVATKLTSQFVRYELDMAGATDLARVAQDAAVISMQDSSEALDGLLHGILTYNPRVLRTYGINVQSADAFQMFADAAGIATDEMDNAQKAQAMLNAVLAEGESITGAYDAAMGSAGKQLRSMSRHWEEAKEGLGEAFLPLMGKAVTATTDLLKAFNALEPAQKKTASSLVGVGTAVTGAAGGFILLAPRIIATTQAMGALGISTAAILPVAAALAASVVAVTMAVSLYNDVQEKTVGVQSAWNAQLKELVDSEMTAEQAMYSYRDSQEAVAHAYAEGGIIAELFIDKQEIAGATTEELTAMVIASATSYADYQAGMELVNDEIEDHNIASKEAANSAGVYASVVQESVPVLNDFQFALASGKIELHDSHAAAILYASGVRDVEGASDAAAGSLYDLSTSASTVAGAFGEMVFDDEQLWNLAMASGASIEALSLLATHLDIATNAEIANTLEGYKLIEMFEAGQIGPEELASRFSALETATIAAEGGFEGLDQDVDATALGLQKAAEITTGLTAEQEALSEATGRLGEVAEETALREQIGIVVEEEAFETARELRLEKEAAIETALGMANATGQETSAAAGLDDTLREVTASHYGLSDAETLAMLKAMGLAGELGGVSGQADAVASAADRATDALNRIPTDIDVVISIVTRGGTGRAAGIEGWQHGTSFFPGGLALVGEGTTAGELVSLPRGSQIYPASSPQTQTFREGDTYGGDNVYINDRLAGALYLEQRRQRKIERAEGMM